MKNRINSHFEKTFLFLIIGFAAIIIPKDKILILHLFLYFEMFIYNIIQIIILLKRNYFCYFYLIFALINIIMLFLNFFTPFFYIKIFLIIIGLYLLLISIAKFATIFIYKKIPCSKINILINSLIHFILSFIIVSNNNLKLITTIIGIYLILLGLDNITKKYYHKSIIKIVEIPIIFQSLKPYNDFINIDLKKFNNSDNDIEVDIEILIHIRKNRRGVFGHSDIIYKGNVYSYGNYDISTYKLSDAIGEGVLVKADKDDYIKYCKNYGKTLFSFGIKLNNEEKVKIDEHFNNIIKKTYVFKKEQIVKDSYIYKLSQHVNTTFYKFKDSYYQNYYFLNYNCVKFIEEIISPDLLNFTSIKTPGTLYSYLNDLYINKNSKVIKKNIY